MSRRWSWFGHSTVRIEWDEGSLVIDPFELREKRARPADLILITNPRLGHFSPEDIALVRHAESEIVGPRELGDAVTRRLAPGDGFEFRGARVTAVPAANRELGFFPRERGWLGYLIEAEGVRYYHAGATDRLPEMDAIRADVAFLPVTGGYVMDEEEANAVAEAVGATERVALFLVGDRFRRLAGFVSPTASGES